MKKSIALILIVISINTVKGQTPAGPVAPAGQKWQLVANMSDEFAGTSLNTSKWVTAAANGWIGRPPGLFQSSAVSVSGGNLKIEAALLPKATVVNGQTFTHRGAIVGSKSAMTYGYYECRMKGNATFMSSTFWLINKKSAGTGCNNRITELDITETVGVLTSSAQASYNKRMNSNTHSREVSCATPTGSVGNKKDLANGALTSAGYHTYGAWWKSATEIRFFLDGKWVYTITPKADFNLPLFLQMAVETYDFNKPPSGGGMGLSLIHI